MLEKAKGSFCTNTFGVKIKEKIKITIMCIPKVFWPCGYKSLKRMGEKGKTYNSEKWCHEQYLFI